MVADRIGCIDSLYFNFFNMKIAHGIIILCAFYLLILSSCGPTEEKKVPPFFPVTQLIARDTIIPREYISDIHAFRKTEIRARVHGYLEQIYVDEGQEVKKDQLLFRINAEEYSAELAEAKATLTSAIAEAKTAQLEYDRVKILVDKQVVSATDLDVARAKYEAFAARVEEARSSVASVGLKVNHTAIRAPFDGTIDRIPFKIGSLIDEGILLTTLSDVRFIYAYFNVSEGEYLQYMRKKLCHSESITDDAELILADGSTHQHRGKIETMEGEFENTTGTIAFRALFPNPNKILKHGASGKVKLTTRVNDVLMVPQKSTVEIQDKTYVFVVDEQNSVTMKSITPGARLSHFYIIEDGLKDGEHIVYEGVQNVKDGMKISRDTIALDSLILLANDVISRI